MLILLLSYIFHNDLSISFDIMQVVKYSRSQSGQCSNATFSSTTIISRLYVSASNISQLNMLKVHLPLSLNLTYTGQTEHCIAVKHNVVIRPATSKYKITVLMLCAFHKPYLELNIPKVRGLKPGWGRWILRVIKSVARLPSEGK
jgi:hypothetical protein